MGWILLILGILGLLMIAPALTGATTVVAVGTLILWVIGNFFPGP